MIRIAEATTKNEAFLFDIRRSPSRHAKRFSPRCGSRGRIHFAWAVVTAKVYILNYDPNQGNTFQLLDRLCGAESACTRVK
jgi:hypothetical protein